jgi:hypothetical protein
MADLLYLLVVVGFFAVAAAFTQGCNKLSQENTDV